MKKKILLSAPVIFLFLFGYFSKSYKNSTSLPMLKLEQKSIKKNKIPVETAITNKPVKILKRKHDNLQNIIIEGGQEIFHLTFDEKFWVDISDKKIEELIKGYHTLNEINKNITSSHEEKIPTHDRTKLGILKSIGVYYLNDKLDYKSRKRMISFHKTSLKKNENIFIKRQLISNLNKILEFNDEKERDRFLASIDKRALYLSRLSVNEIISKVLDENK